MRLRDGWRREIDEVLIHYLSQVRVPEFSGTPNKLSWPQSSFQEFLLLPSAKDQLEAHP